MKGEKQIAKLVWSEGYASGLIYLDNHRRNFVDILNELVEVVNEGSCESMLPMIFHRLAFYAEDYFTKKEMAMSDCEELPLNTYKSEHDRFSNAIHRCQQDFSDGNTNVCSELLSFLIEWFENYVKIFDENGVEYMRNRGFE